VRRGLLLLLLLLLLVVRARFESEDPSERRLDAVGCGGKRGRRPSKDPSLATVDRWSSSICVFDERTTKCRIHVIRDVEM
jgi:hypothetical protein